MDIDIDIDMKDGADPNGLRLAPPHTWRRNTL